MLTDRAEVMICGLGRCWRGGGEVVGVAIGAATPVDRARGTEKWAAE